MDRLKRCDGAVGSSRLTSRRALLLGTALASSLIALPTLTATPANAVTPCVQPAPTTRIDDNAVPDDVTCVNTVTRINLMGDAIGIDTVAPGGYIRLDNSGMLTAANAVLADTRGIYTLTNSDGSFITIVNTGQIGVTATAAFYDGYGIQAFTGDQNSPITIDNAGNIGVIVTSNYGGGTGISGFSLFSSVAITNTGGIEVNSAYSGRGINAVSFSNDSGVTVNNFGDIDITADFGYGISAQAGFVLGGPLIIQNSGDIDVVDAMFGTGIRGLAASSANITNSGDITIAASDGAYGIRARGLVGSVSPISITNNGAIISQAQNGVSYGIFSDTDGDNSAIAITNNGGITVTAGQGGYGIDAYTYGVNSRINIDNSARIGVRAGADGYGIRAETYDADSAIIIGNSGELTVMGGRDGYGIFAFTNGPSSTINITNSGDLTVGSAGVGRDAIGIFGESRENASPVSITNSGDVIVSATGPGANSEAAGIDIETYGDNSGATVINSGNVFASGAGADQTADGLELETYGANSPIQVFNSGSIAGEDTGIRAYSITLTTVTNQSGGNITAGSGLAIDVLDIADDAFAGVGGGPARIFNAGTITGFVDLTNNNDLFVNQSGGLFQAQQTSFFGGGVDRFTNEEGGVVDTANAAGIDEDVRFVGLETFQNFGTISLLDGAPGDLFTISNTPMMTDLNYVAGSFLAVDAFLGGPGSRSDIFRIDGNVAGVTDVIVNNTGPAIGVFNPVGITVVQVRGNVDPSAFRLVNGPIDTGFFNFDLFTENDGTFTNFELRSFPGAGAQLLPQLVTAAQDIWHQTSDTWFDRSADLRTQLWRNGGSVAGMPGVMSLGGGSAKDGVVAEQGGLSPAVWARVSHGELEQDGAARTNAFGRSFSFNLDRELYIIDVQSGVDFALKGVMNPADVLLLSVFGGGVSANLQYDQLDRRRFDYDGGQVGVAATYLSGGLFVDALFNAQFLEVDPNALGFAESLDSNAYGFRIDSGYRFGMGSRGLFLEPLLTLAYVNSDLDGFSFAGNTVSFQDEDSLRGRVGLRAGTSLFIENVRFEPFVIASYWGELSDDDNRATLVSSGTRFGFRDEREDGWGEVSLGTNTFLAGNNALSAFSKIDIIFGDDTEGYIAQGGFRVQW